MDTIWRRIKIRRKNFVWQQIGSNLNSSIPCPDSAVTDEPIGSRYRGYCDNQSRYFNPCFPSHDTPFKPTVYGDRRQKELEGGRIQ